MFASALMILLPLFVGFALLVNNRHALTVIHHGVNTLVYLILLMLGVGLGQLEQLASLLSVMAFQVVVLLSALLAANLLALWLWHRWQPMAVGDTDDRAEAPGARRLFLSAVKPLLAVLVGVMAGLWVLPAVAWVEDMATGLLMALLLLIGIQLRNAGLSLHRLLLNRQGLGIALAVVVSSLLAGLVAAPLLDIPLARSLALASGFGWYSLSGIVVGDALGPAWGAVAFLNDVLREILALALIPLLMPRAPALGIGYGGATAMDFTLPVIRSHGGLHCVPVAIASGFLLSLLSPVLMGLFLSLAGH